MLSRKNRLVAFVATCAAAAALAIPAFAQALWIDDTTIESTGGTLDIYAMAESRPSSQTINVTYYTDGPSISGPATVTVPPNSYWTSFPVSIGPGNPGDTMFVAMQGPTSQGGCEIWMY